MDKPDDDEEEDNAQDSWTTLILILIHEHLLGPASRWYPYLSVLPASTEELNTPMFWTPSELATLQASPVASKVGHDDAEAMIRSKILPVIRAHEDVFFPAGAPTAKPTDDGLVQLAFRMGSVIMAYAFDLDNDADSDAAGERQEGGEESDGWVEDRDGQTTLGMVPMADILNADASFNAHIEHGTDALTATSLRPIGKGEEVLNYYGPLSNGELLRRYGYVTAAHRRWDLVDLAWDAVLDALRASLANALGEPEWERVVALLDEDELEEDGFIIERGAGDPDSEGRVEGVTGKVGVPEELLEQMKDVMKVVKKVKPEAVPDKVSRDRVIYSAMAKALEERTRQYGTTLEQDKLSYTMDLQGQSKVSGIGQPISRERMARDVRIGEKELLREASETVKGKLAVLSVAQRDGDGRSAKRRKM